MESKMKRIALVGNPNSGKTALFNVLTGLNQRVSNYPGVTVESATGKAIIDGESCLLTDLPGTYSLAPESQDEQIVAEEVATWIGNGHAPDCVISVVDSTNLQRNLYLTSQLIDLGIPVVVALNMTDIAEQKSIHINLEQLKSELGLEDVVQISALKKTGIFELKQVIHRILSSEKSQPNSIQIPDPVMTIIQPVIDWFSHEQGYSQRISQSLALRWITTGTLYGLTVPNSTLLENTRISLKQIGFSFELLEPTLRYGWLDSIVPKSQQTIQTQSKSELIDKYLIHPVGGPIIFVALLTFIFQAIFSWASIPMDWIDSGIGTVGEWVGSLLPSGLFNDLMVEGIIGGAGAILVFLPQILILVFFLSLLEDSGYMARVAIMMDKAMTKVGLHGRSVLPLMSGYACAIPGVMATRTIDSWKERLITILVLPLMSCSARLPVYTLMIAAFIPDIPVLGYFGLQGLTLVFMYFLGSITAMILALIFHKWINIEQKTSFVMELPSYRMPLMRSVFQRVYSRGAVFVKDAGKIIMAISIVLWFLASFPKSDSNVTQSIHHSYAAKIGQTIEPIIKPLGFDWKIGLGLVTSFAAREVIVSTLATIYNVENAEENPVSLSEAMKRDVDPKTGKNIFTPLVAFSLMIFYVFAAQCMATFAIIKRETNSWKWPIFMVIYMTTLAYIGSLIVYQGGLALGLS